MSRGAGPVTTAPPVRSRTAILVLLSLAIGWVAMYTMHLDAGDGAQMSMGAAGSVAGTAARSVTDVRLDETRPSVTVRPVAERCESPNSDGLAPRSGVSAPAAPVLDDARATANLQRCGRRADTGTIRALPPPNLHQLAISRT